MTKPFSLVFKSDKKTKFAFSLMEATFILVVTSLIMAAVLPVVTKKSFQTPPLATHGSYFCYYKDGKLYEDKLSGKIIQKRVAGYPKQVTKCAFSAPKNASYFEITAIGGGGAGGAGVSGDAVKFSDIKTNERKFAPVAIHDNGGITQADIDKYKLDVDKLGKVWLFARGANSSDSDVARQYLFDRTTDGTDKKLNYYMCNDASCINACRTCAKNNNGNNYIGLSENVYIESNKTSKKSYGYIEISYNKVDPSCHSAKKINCDSLDKKLANKCTDSVNEECGVLPSTGRSELKVGFIPLSFCHMTDGESCPGVNTSAGNKITTIPFVLTTSDLCLSNPKLKCYINPNQGECLLLCDKKHRKDDHYTAIGGEGALCFSTPTKVDSGLKLSPWQLPTGYVRESNNSNYGFVADKDTIVKLYKDKNVLATLTAGRSLQAGHAIYVPYLGYEDGKPGSCYSGTNKITTQKGDINLDCISINDPTGEDNSPYGYCYSKDGNSVDMVKNGLIDYFSINTKANIKVGNSGIPGEAKTVIVRSLAGKDVDIHIGRGGNAALPDKDGKNKAGIVNGGNGSATYLGTESDKIVYAEGGKGGKGGIADKKSNVVLPAYNSKTYTKDFTAGDCNVSGSLCTGIRGQNLDTILNSIDKSDELYKIVETAGYSGMGGGVKLNNSDCYGGQYLSFANGKLMPKYSIFSYPDGVNESSNADNIAKALNDYFQLKMNIGLNLTSSDINKKNMIPTKCKDWKNHIISPTNGKDGMLIIRW